MNLQALSIQQFKRHGQEILNDDILDCLHDDIMITNNISYTELFKYPCRLDAITMLICLDGELTGTVNLKQYVLGKNSVFLGLPTDIIQINSVTNLKMYVIIISASLLKEVNVEIQNIMSLYLKIRQRSIYVIADKEFNLLNHYYALTQAAIHSKDESARSIIKALLTAFLYHICSFVNKQEYVVDEKSKKHMLRNEYAYDRFMNLLSKFHTKERYVTFYAAKMCITPKYLSMIIKEVSGKTAANWIDEYVVLEAKNSLKYSNLSIQEVAYHLNFATQSSFGKYFKQQTGFSPKQYINQMDW